MKELRTQLLETTYKKMKKALKRINKERVRNMTIQEFVNDAVEEKLKESK